MKNIYLLFAIIIVLFAACTPKVKKDSALICGHIENPTGKIIVLKNSDFCDSISLDESNNFTHKFKTQDAAYYTFWLGREFANLYIQPGDSIGISLSADNFDKSLKFSGIGANENNYLISKILFESSMDINYELLFQQNEKKFTVQIESMYDLQLKHFEKFLKTNTDINKKFIEIEKAKLLYTWAENKASYERTYNLTLKKDNKELNKKFYNYLSKINLNDSTLLDIPEYKSFLKTYFENKANDAIQNTDNPEKFIPQFIKIVSENIKDKKVKSMVLFNTIKEHIGYYGVNFIKPQIEEFRKNCTTEKYQKEINELYEKWEKITTGNQAASFQLLDITGKIHTMDEFKGKYLYIDIWATWCGPCKREIPILNELQNEFKNNKNIAFVSISIDENKEAWEKMITEDKPSWLQLHAAKGASSIVKDYIINFIPRFILIDRDGKIIDAKAPAPSEKKLKDLLNGLEGLGLTAKK